MKTKVQYTRSKWTERDEGGNTHRAEDISQW